MHHQPTPIGGTPVIRWGDFRVLGELTPDVETLLDAPYAMMTGRQWEKTHPKFRQSTRDGCWKADTRTLRDWIDRRFSRHPVHADKQGDCLILGTSPYVEDAVKGTKGCARKKEAVTQMAWIGVDIDCGGEIDDTVDRIRAAGYFAIVHSTHSHGSTVLMLKRDEIVTKMEIEGEVTSDHVRAFFRQHPKVRYSEAFIESIDVQDQWHETSEGPRVLCASDPQQKFRVFLPLEVPVEMKALSNRNTDARAIWADAVTGLATVVLGTHFDTACTDVTRLFYTPKHSEGREFRGFIIYGRALPFSEIPLRSKNDYARERTMVTITGMADNPWAIASAHVKDHTPVVVSKGGFNVTEWRDLYKHRWMGATAIQEVCPDKLAEGGKTGDMAEIQCPFEESHSGDPNTACAIWDPLVSIVDDEVFIKCQHDACKHVRTQDEYVAKMVDDGWFEPSFLTDESYLEEPSDQDLEVLDEAAQHEVKVARIREERRARQQKSWSGQSPSQGGWQPEGDIENDPLFDKSLLKGKMTKKKASLIRTQILQSLRARVLTVRMGGKPKFCTPCEVLHRFEVFDEKWLKLVLRKHAFTVKVDDDDIGFDPFSMFQFDSERKDYAGIVFQPDLKLANPRHFNTWTGLAVQPKAGSWARLNEHIKQIIIADNGGSPEANERLYNWLIGWMAQIVQQPAIKRGSAVVLLGEQGTGKTKLAEWFAALFGVHATVVESTERLLNRFNSFLHGKVFVVAEEVEWPGTPGIDGRLKFIVTGTDLQIERKGVDLEPEPNYARFMLASNKSWVVPADANGDMRRFFCLKVSPARKQDRAYFATIDEEMDNGGLEAMLADLLAWRPEDHDMTWGDLNFPPETAEGRKQAAQSLVGVPSILKGLIDAGEIEGVTQKGEGFFYTLSETEPTMVARPHLNRLLSPKGPANGGIGVAIETTLHDFLGPDCTTGDSKKWVAFQEARPSQSAREKDDQQDGDKVVGANGQDARERVWARAVVFPALRDVRAALAKRFA